MTAPVPELCMQALAARLQASELATAAANTHISQLKEQKDSLLLAYGEQRQQQRDSALENKEKAAAEQSTLEAALQAQHAAALADVQERLEAATAEAAALRATAGKQTRAVEVAERAAGTVLLFLSFCVCVLALEWHRATEQAVKSMWCVFYTTRAGHLHRDDQLCEATGRVFVTTL